MKDEIYKFFADYVFKHSGISYKPGDYYRLDSRIMTLMRAFSVDTPEALYQLYVQNISKEMHTLLIDLFTNNETYFMRDVKPFKALAKGILPALVEKMTLPTPIQIWSCACSTGQEIYSIMMATETFGSSELLSKIRIEATDLSTEALAKAQKAEYNGLEVQRGLPANLLIKYFEKKEDQELWSVKPELKSRVTFAQFNLLKDKYPINKYHIVFCRNVLIYQEIENKRYILEKIHDALKPGGYLIFGAGESLIGVTLPFTQVEFEGAYVYQKKS
ncbi:MAG: chemotaxis protein CheR [Bdellovibrio sp. CG12_big_fil_rev_8_21_14_0_65_39_13]|nr:MAG: chemotaxis protein CheR [Bdellovibrio sp. CG22_combo_CG10-13_8_21_14_all_39_27]PIQ61080.1 MAG: chemotaxis protein CheR [Bdellovibrio sp. CG12_big_fil_rev_8_21_14_0_65_39_13]PIR36848.1 MAG: chemotaxis protein CheR [Bdellovibrio sp. CG11_big_fil_rev_8_21_14_0_20_39_38]